MRWVRSSTDPDGFALPLALGMGLVMFTIAVTTIMVAQGDRNTSSQRKENSSSYVVAEGGVARVLAQLALPNNAVLLTRNYDPNTNNGKNYLGPDGIANSQDETTTNVNEWASYSPPTTAACGSTTAAPNIDYTDPIGTTGQYTLKAYRYNPIQKTGTFLVEGVKGNAKAYIAATLTILPVANDFPGIVASETVYLQGRSVSGSNANIYFNPNNPYTGYSGLTGFALPGNSSRPQYLNGVWAGSSDGFNGDPVSGKITACALNLTIPDTPQGTGLGNIKNTSRTISATGSGITHYTTAELMLQASNVLTVDTTAGPVYLYVTNKFILEGSSKIQNIRTDGQPPKVGDLRIFATGGSGHEILIKNTACIQKAFIFNKESDLQIQTTGSSCANGANVEGVIWAEDLLSSKTNASARIDPDTTEGDSDNSATPGSTSGIIVPEDVSSLSDILSSVGITPRYRFGKVKNWQRIRL
jgi:hypothetical protein